MQPMDRKAGAGPPIPVVPVKAGISTGYNEGMASRRIVIIGCPGSGKSTLARRLGERLGLPVVHLDVLYWQPGWKPSGKEEFRARVAAAHAGNAWISEGDFASLSFDLRLPRADALIVIERSRWLCLWRVVWRAITDRRDRPDLPAGCPERPDRELMLYIWNYEKGWRPQIEAARLEHGRDLPMIRLRSDREISAFMAGRH